MINRLFRIVLAIYVAIGAVWLSLKIALPVMTYEGASPDTIRLGKQVSLGAIVCLVVLTVTVFLISRLPHFAARRAKLAAQNRAEELPSRVSSRVTTVTVVAMTAMIGATFLVPAGRTRDLVSDLSPVAFLLIFFVGYIWFARYYRRTHKQDRDPNSA